jgi:hypothetical protein
LAWLGLLGALTAGQEHLYAAEESKRRTDNTILSIGIRIYVDVAVSRMKVEE